MRFSIFIFMLVILLAACTIPSSDPEPLQLHEVAYGGCAGSFDIPEVRGGPPGSKFIDYGPDTLIVQWDDSLRIFLGLNYLCCTPFNADHEVRRDTLVLAVWDTCPDPDTQCYCDCMCYYTFTWTFAGGGEDLHYLQVELYDPRIDTVEVLYMEPLAAP